MIGRKIKGFKFEGKPGLEFNPDMNECIGDIGEIDSYAEYNNSFYVTFRTCSWSYPAELIEQHLIEEQMKTKCIVLGQENEPVKWVSVSDDLPIENSNILVRFINHAGTHADIATFRDFSFLDYNLNMYPIVTHWQPLPEPPKH